MKQFISDIFSNRIVKFEARGFQEDSQGFYIKASKLPLRDRILIFIKGAFFVRFIGLTATKPEGEDSNLESPDPSRKKEKGKSLY